MENYYDEILAEIREMMDRHEEEEALIVIRKELRMPYIPPEIEKKLHEYEVNAKQVIADRRQLKEESLDSLLKKLRGTDQQQLAAAAQLTKRNLRDILTEIRSYLQSNPCPEAAALIIEAIAEQEIKEEFTLVKDGMRAEFYGDSVIPCSESGGFRKAYACLKEWLENDNPAMLEMCRTLLIREVYLFLPLSYDEEEGEDLALGILEQVSDLMDGGATYRAALRTMRQTAESSKMS